MTDKIYSILKRFIKGAIGGGVAQMAIVTFTTPTAWSDFPSILNTLGIAFATGAISGLLLALQKWSSWTE